MSKIGRANEQNRPNLEELQQREIGSFWSIIGSGLRRLRALYIYGQKYRIRVGTLPAPIMCVAYNDPHSYIISTKSN